MGDEGTGNREQGRVMRDAGQVHYVPIANRQSLISNRQSPISNRQSPIANLDEEPVWWNNFKTFGQPHSPR
jgi:hypothetical protein